MHQFPRKLAVGAILASVLFAGGCETLGYYSQAISGQLHLLAQREPVADVLRDIDARGALTYLNQSRTPYSYSRPVARPSASK